MGFNTTIVVRNDALGDIAGDKNFGKYLASAVAAKNNTCKPVYVPAGGTSFAAVVVETHDANNITVVSVGKDRGKSLGTVELKKLGDNEDVQVLKALANKLGYRVCKKPKS